VSRLVTLVVGEIGRSNAQRGRGRRPAGAGAAAGPGETDGPGTRQWSCQWGPDGPGPVAPGGDGDADLTLSLSPGDADLVRQGQLAPSVAFMQGRLKTSGDNGLLLEVLAWTATPAFGTAMRSWAADPAMTKTGS
jgi:hypothetical protein